MLDTLNQRASKLIESARPRFDELGIVSTMLPCGGEVLDFATGRVGTSAAGLLLAEICMAGLGRVSMHPSVSPRVSLPTVQVATDHPLLACLASQYAGWPFSHEQYFAMCSGPARSCRGKEAVLERYDLVCASPVVVAVLEANDLPNDKAFVAFAKECGVSPTDVTLCIARTASLPGSIQVVARSVETALHKLHELEFDLRSIVSGCGTAPLPPIAADDLTALGWTNDSVLYGGHVNLVVDCEDAAVTDIGSQVPSCSSDDFGAPFLETFERYDRDFYKIDKLLFSPAVVVFNNVRSGRVFSFGDRRDDVLQSSWQLN